MRKSASVLMLSFFAVSQFATAGADVVSRTSATTHQSATGSIHTKGPVDTSAKTSAGASANGNGALNVEKNSGSLTATGKTNANANASDSTTVDVSKGK